MNTQSLRVRHGQPADAPALARFAARIFADTFGPDNRPENIAAHLAKSFGPAHQGRELADPDFVTVLVDHGGEIVGYAQVRRAAPPACVTTGNPVELYRFYVDRPWQGTGLAQQLMAAVHAAAATLGGRSIWLCVWEKNPRAISFYTRCGYNDVGGATFHLGPERQFDRVLVAEVQESAVRPT